MTTRPSGYYWIIFDYGTGAAPRWEPGGWDADAGTWALMGSRGEWQEFQLVAVGPPVGEAPPLPSKGGPA